jgi:heme-degrading monooxygenase HmoA
VISRQWRGLSKPECADAYVAHLRTETFPALRTIPGFSSATILRRRTHAGVEFLIVTQWTSIDAIREFAGAEAEAAVVPQEVQDMMIEYDRSVRHYEVVA